MAAWSHAYPRLSVPTAPYCSVWAAQEEAHGSAPFWEAGLGRRSSDLDRHGMQAQPVSRPAQLRRESIAGAQSHCSCLGQKAELRLACPPDSLVHWGWCRADFVWCILCAWCLWPTGTHS